MGDIMPIKMNMTSQIDLAGDRALPMVAISRVLVAMLPRLIKSAGFL